MPATKGGKEPRGVRNNNPGNIRHSPAHWVGQSEVQDDKSFVTFDTMSYGCRALCVLLLNYQSKYGLHSIRELISRWAPPNENNTSAYIASVAKYCGLSETMKINLTNSAYLYEISAAIICHENGYFCPPSDIKEALIEGVREALHG